MAHPSRSVRSLALGATMAAVVLFAGLTTRGEEADGTLRSPVNQTFQFMRSGTCSAWANGDRTNATAYLWVPEQCKKLRGLVVMCTNVPEHRLAGHPAIRDVCAANDLGIVFSVPTFLNFNAKNDHATTAAFLQQLLDGLAERSGYAEVATVPWLPMGESGHLLMVDALVEARPDRCIAGVWIKNSHLPPKNRTTPALVIYGTSQEWDQEKIDIRTRWNDTKAYDTIVTQRHSHPDWPLSYVIDGGSGHFDCSERLTTYIARYIDAAAKARLSDDGSPQLKPVMIEKGFLADLPVPGHENHPATPVAQTLAAARGVPWFFNLAAAEAAQSIARINWKAETQFVDFADAAGRAMPLNFRGIPTFAPETGPDGITFTLHGMTLDKIPDNFAAAGQPLPRAPGQPTIEWLCGPIAPLGNDTFQIALDRTWGITGPYLAVRHKGTDTIRDAVLPGGVQLHKNSEGRPQTITFDKIPDAAAGTTPIPLSARTDVGMPVRFYVIAGPAIAEGGKLVLTKIPPRTKYPIDVTVAAWQWGRSIEPKVKTAETVTQTFRVLAP